MFEIALSNHAVYAVACAKRDSVSESQKCSVKLSPMPRTEHRINEFASHIQIPKFNYQTAFLSFASRSATAFNNTKIRSHRQVDFETFLERFRDIVALDSHDPRGQSTSLDHPARRPLSSSQIQQNFWASPNNKLMYSSVQPLPRELHPQNPAHRQRTRPSSNPPTLKGPEFGPPQHGDNGPCRNRTYNLAIKSHLLCQLS